MVFLVGSREYRGVEQLVARRAHNPKVTGSSPVPATKTSIVAVSFLGGTVAILFYYEASAFVQLIEEMENGTMKNLIERILHNSIFFEILSIFVYSFYCLVFAIALLPSVLVVRWGTQILDGTLFRLILFIGLCSLTFYLFVISAAIVIGITERLLTLGFKPGAYPTGSPIFLRWLAYAGLHMWAVVLIFSFLQGTNWIKIYLRLAGAKVGKSVFINTKRIYDPYLLQIKDNVIVGGEATIMCHLFEGGRLILGEVILESGTSVGANSYLTPGTHTGQNSSIGIYTNLRRNTVMKDGEVLITPPSMSLRQAAKIMRMVK